MKMMKRTIPILHSACRAICFFFFILLFSFIYISCTANNKNVYRYAGGELRLDVVNDSLSIIRHLAPDGHELSSFRLPYPTYRFCCGDLSGDGLPEIGVGVIKSTRFSPEPDKRLFIFHLTDGRLIRPLWMGSHVSGRLLDFHFTHDETGRHGTYVVTTEQCAADSIVHRTYKLSAFGLKSFSL